MREKESVGKGREGKGWICRIVRVGPGFMDEWMNVSGGNGMSVFCFLLMIKVGELYASGLVMSAERVGEVLT